MADPMSLVALGAAVGGATSKFVEKAWDSGEKWISSYLQDHHPSSIQEAQKNTANFIVELAGRVKALEDRGAVSPDEIEAAQKHPSFSVALQAAMIAAAQTNDKDKHRVLAMVLSEKLRAQPETLRAITSKMAVNAIGCMTPNQLKLLGFSADLYCVSPSKRLSSEEFSLWLERRLKPYAGLTYTALDLIHLESLSCLKYTPMFSRVLMDIIASKNGGLVDSNLLGTVFGVGVDSLWKKGVLSVDLTSVGQLLGIKVSDLLSGEETSFVGWD
jgi:hypothetical protein